MKKYVKPYMDFTRFEIDDIITASTGGLAGYSFLEEDDMIMSLDESSLGIIDYSEFKKSN